MFRNRPRVLISVFLIATVAAVPGCGSSDGDGVSQADNEQLTALAGKINDVSQKHDAAGFCAILSPAEIKKTFHSRAVCTTEYKKIFASIKNPGTATLEDISVNGDTAEVTFKEQNTPVKLVREGGRWWLALDQATGSGTATGSTGTSRGTNQ